MRRMCPSAPPFSAGHPPRPYTWASPHAWATYSRARARTQAVVSEPSDQERERRRQLNIQKEELRRKRVEQVRAWWERLHIRACACSCGVVRAAQAASPCQDASSCGCGCAELCAEHRAAQGRCSEADPARHAWLGWVRAPAIQEAARKQREEDARRAAADAKAAEHKSRVEERKAKYVRGGAALARADGQCVWE